MLQRAALDLEHAQRIRALEHGIDAWELARHGRELEVDAIACPQHPETAPDRRQHAEREHVDLHDPERVDIVLVPFDEGAVRHRGIAHRHRLDERPLRQHEAADMLREMAGELDQLAGELQRERQARVLLMQPGAVDIALPDAVAP
jgi:hypothetical protein